MFEAKWYMGDEAVKTIEKLNIPVTAEDAYAMHVFVTKKDGGDMIALGTACPDGATGDIEIKRIVMMPEYSMTIFDEFVLRMLLYKLQELENKVVYMWADGKQQKLLSRFGFSQADKNGDGLLKLAVNTSSIVWPKECNC